MEEGSGTGTHATACRVVRQFGPTHDFSIIGYSLRATHVRTLQQTKVDCVPAILPDKGSIEVHLTYHLSAIVYSERIAEAVSNTPKIGH